MTGSIHHTSGPSARGFPARYRPPSGATGSAANGRHHLATLAIRAAGGPRPAHSKASMQMEARIPGRMSGEKKWDHVDRLVKEHGVPPAIALNRMGMGLKREEKLGSFRAGCPHSGSTN
jgi:hypothetical protein